MKKIIALTITSMLVYAGNWSPENHPGNLCEANSGYWIWSSTKNDFTCKKNFPKDVQMDMVQKNPNSIKDILSPHPEVQLLAVNKDPSLFNCITDPDEKVQLFVFSKDPNLLLYMTNPTNDMMLTALEKNPANIKYISKPDENMQFFAISKRPDLIEHIANPTEKIQRMIATKEPSLIKHIHNPIKEIALIQTGINKRPSNFKTADKYIELTLENPNKLKITNNTDNFIRIGSLAEYFGKDIKSYDSFSIPPQGIYTNYLMPLNTVKVNSLNDTIIYGFAIEYTLPNTSKQSSIFKTNIYKLSDF